MAGNEGTFGAVTACPAAQKKICLLYADKIIGTLRREKKSVSKCTGGIADVEKHRTR